MEHTIVQYRLDPARRDEHETLVAAVFAELHDQRPPGLRYRTVRRPDGVSYVHLADHATGAESLTGLASFQAFRAGLGARCLEPAQVDATHLLGSYGFGA